MFVFKKKRHEEGCRDDPTKFFLKLRFPGMAESDIKKLLEDFPTRYAALASSSLNYLMHTFCHRCEANGCVESKARGILDELYDNASDFWDTERTGVTSMEYYGSSLSKLDAAVKKITTPFRQQKLHTVSQNRGAAASSVKASRARRKRHRPQRRKKGLRSPQKLHSASQKSDVAAPLLSRSVRNRRNKRKRKQQKLIFVSAALSGDVATAPEEFFQVYEKKFESAFLKRSFAGKPDEWWPEFESAHPDLIKAMQESVYIRVNERFVDEYKRKNDDLIAAWQPVMSGDAAIKLYDEVVKSIHKHYDTTQKRVEKGYDFWWHSDRTQYITEPVNKAIDAIFEKRRQSRS